VSQTDSKCCCGSKSCSSEPCFMAKNYFVFRRLHSLSGIIPVGVFCIVHLFTNFQIMIQQIPFIKDLFNEADIFQHEVDFIHSMPALLFVEIGLWSAIGFHAILGIAYTIGGKSNTTHYKYEKNYRYTLQRVTGIIALIFIFVHVATLRWRWNLGGWFTPFYAHGPNGEPLVTATTAYALQAHWLVSAFYLIGALGVVYHWANGLWTAAITWGVTITPAAQARWNKICAGLGVALAIFTVGAVIGANTYQIKPHELEAIHTMMEHGAHYRETADGHECPMLKDGQAPTDDCCPVMDEATAGKAVVEEEAAAKPAHTE